MNLDVLKLFPNQGTDGDPNECVALTITDMAGNADGRPYDSDFTYAATFYLEGVKPDNIGTDPFIGMESAVGLGLLPSSEDAFTTKAGTGLLQVSAQYAADWVNYTPQQKTSALAHAKNGFMNLEGMGATDYDSIIAYLKKYKLPVSFPMTWFSSFSYPVDGTLPVPSGSTSNHNGEIVGYDEMTGNLIAKFWLGPDYGDKGYGYITKDICNTVCRGIYGFNPNAIRFFSLLGILINKGFPASIVSQLIGINHN